ncbi:MAG: cysteine hydrolase family protein [Candidatus Methylomirabilia bacterium]
MNRDETFERALGLAPGQTALIVVDMQKGFVEPGEAMEVPLARAIVPQIQALLGGFREKRLSVIFTQFVYSQKIPLLVGELHPEHRRAQPGAPRGFGLPSSSCLEGEASVNIIPELAPQPGELVITKHWYDAFNGTPLDGALRARGIHHVVFAGTMTDICVLASVVGAFNREYRCLVVEDAVATLQPEVQQVTLDVIRRAYARVISTKEVAREIALW